MSLLNKPAFWGSLTFGSWRRTMYFLVKVQRLSVKSVYDHIVNGFVGSRLSRWDPRAGIPAMATPPGAIMVSDHGANRFIFPDIL